MKYATDLMETEVSIGFEVTALYPGNFDFSVFNIKKSEQSRIQNEKDRNGIRVFRLTNALPVPLMYGIKRPNCFMRTREIKGFEEFFNSVRPDVFHIHTLMGLPIELLQLLKSKNVRIVYTTHDYFGLCPKVNFIDNKGMACNSASAMKCMKCCSDSPSQIFLKLRNSKLTVSLKKLIQWM